MIKSRFFRVFFILILVYLLIPIQNNLLSDVPKRSIQTLREEEFYVNIVFVGFDENLILEENIEYIMGTINIDPLQYTNGSFPHARYGLNYTFSYLSESQNTEFENFLLDNAENKTLAGYRANITAIDELLATENFTDINDYFLPYGGLVINATLVEDYIYQNLFEEKSKLEYTLYMLNFSKYDSSDHSLDHIYSVEHHDYDSGTHFPTQYPNNDTISYAPVAGWGGKHRFCFIDPSASLDYIQVLPLLYGLDVDFGDQNYYRYDLDGYCKTLNLTEYLGQASLAIYLQEWIQTYLYNIFCPTTIVTPPVTETFSVQVNVINNATHLGYLTESFNWITSVEKLLEPLSSSFPWIEWDVQVNLSKSLDHTELYSTMINSVYQDEFGYYFVNVTDGLLDIFTNEFEPYFDLDKAETVIPAFVFITDDTTFRWSEEHFFGDNIFGTPDGFDTMALTRSVYELFENGSLSNPQLGLSTILLRLIGHWMSFPITYRDYYGWGTAYVNDVMSIFARELCGSYNFSTFYRDAYARYFYDYYYYHTNIDFLSVLAEYDSVGKLIGLDKYQTQINTMINESYELYHSMQYVLAIEKIFEARTLIDEFKTNIENRSAFQKPAVFWSVTIAGSVVGVAVMSYIVQKYLIPFFKRK